MITWPTVHLRDGENPWVTYFKRQTTYKNNCINCVVTGMPGMGKSWGLIYVLSNADSSFDSSRIFFKASEMLKWINDGNLRRGRAFMFDEAGIVASSLSWWDEINKGLNAFFQTARSDNYIFGMTVPFISYVSKGVRTLMNVRFHAEGWTDENQTKLKAWHMEYNGDMDKFYRKRLLVKGDGGADYVGQIRVPKASNELIKRYEEMKADFKGKLYQNIGAKIVKHEEKAMGKPQRLSENQVLCLEHRRMNKTYRQIADDIGKTYEFVRDRLAECRERGHDTKITENDDKLPKMPRKRPFLGQMGHIHVPNSG